MANKKSKNKVKQTEATPNPRREEVKLIGFSAEDAQNVIEPDLQPIRRNSSNQIISYTLPKNKPKQSSAIQYGNVLIPAVTSQLNKIEFNRVIDNDIEQFTRTIDDIDIEIKKRNDIYYEMYKDALRKAKMAKDLALNSFLEAKRIKNTYMLDDLDDSDLEEEESVTTNDE